MRLRLTLVAASLAVALCAHPAASAQSHVVFEEDFENGFGAWTTKVSPTYDPVQWHIAEPGDCGIAVTRMAAIGSGCGYGGAVRQQEKLITPLFVVPAAHGLLLSMDVFWDMDLGPGSESNLSITTSSPGQPFTVQSHSFTAQEQGVFTQLHVF